MPKVHRGVALRRRNFARAAFVVLALTSAQWTLSARATQEPQAAAVSYDQAVQKARQLMEAGELPAAYVAASAAVTLNGRRWEAYALMAMVLEAQTRQHC